MGGAVLLVPGSAPAVDKDAVTLIRKLNPSAVVIAGGPASVSPGIEAAASGLSSGGVAFRMGGSDRYESSANINREAFLKAETVFLATGHNFPDALAGAALAGKVRAPLYAVPGTCVPADVLEDIKRLAPSKIVLLGGLESLTLAVERLAPC